MRLKTLLETLSFRPYHDHTVWISPEGKVTSLHGEGNTHFQWIADNFFELFPDLKGIIPNPAQTGKREPDFSNAVYDVPVERGWVRIRNTHSCFNIQSKHEAANKLFSVWWPVARERLREEGELSIFIDYVPPDGNSRNSLGFMLPRDMEKLRKWIKTPISEGMYNMKPIVKKSSSAQPHQASNDIYVDISEDHANTIGITLKGRTALITNDRAEKLAEKLLLLVDKNSPITEEAVELSNKAQDLIMNYLQHLPKVIEEGKHDKEVIEEAKNQIKKIAVRMGYSSITGIF